MTSLNAPCSETSVYSHWPESKVSAYVNGRFFLGQGDFGNIAVSLFVFFIICIDSYTFIEYFAYHFHIIY